MDVEGSDEAVLKDVRKTLQLPRDQRDRNRLALCTVVLSGRTAKSIDRLTAAVSEIVEEFTRRLFRMHGLSPPTEMEIKAANPADDLAPAISVETVFDMQPLISDLRMKLLIATVGNQFITSDHPTVITNQRFQGRADFPSTSGLAMKGIQLFLPLSPSACLMLYDPSCYRVGGGPRRNGRHRPPGRHGRLKCAANLECGLGRLLSLRTLRGQRPSASRKVHATAATGH